ncbi:MAG: hypothetical protein AAGI12_15535 [Pseudomonadota bacterium]
MSRTAVRASEAICAAARHMWPSKTAINLASRAGVTRRAAELWLSGDNEISGEAQANLLRSDAGFPFMQAIMGGADTRWWRDFERSARLREIEQRIEWQTEQLANLKAEISR